MASATSVTASGGTCAVTVMARSAESETETDCGVSEAGCFLPSCMETVGKSLRRRVVSLVSPTTRLCGVSLLISRACLGSSGDGTGFQSLVVNCLSPVWLWSIQSVILKESYLL